MPLAENQIRTEIVTAFREMTGRAAPKEINVTFYPFASLNHTIRIRRQRVYVRISDILRDAPVAIWRAVAHLLVAKLLKHPPPADLQALYREYSYQPEVIRAIDLVRRHRGRKLAGDPVGSVYNLEAIFRRLNRRYFAGSLAMPRLAWSARRSKRILGHQDDVHETIVISRSLDSEEVPEYVVEFVLYHEMLHLKHPRKIVGGRRIYHSAAFRADERRFLRYDEALAALDRLGGE